MIIKITKLQELPDAIHPNNISVGFEKKLYLDNNVTPIKGVRFPPMCYWSTSIVTEIIDENTFKTLNSVYRWEVLDED